MEGLCERDGTMGSGEDDLLVFADEDPGTHPKYPDETIVRNTAEQTINRMIRTIEIAEREIPLRIAAISAEDFYHDSRGRENHESPLFRQLARFGAILGVSREPHVSCFMDEDGGRSGVFTYE
ncbi:MAG TPA: hypothetical protein PK765_03690 [bacterium]|nr:hypothetical protein [bacterium]